MKKIIVGVGMLALTLVAGGFAHAASIGTVSGGSNANVKDRFNLNWSVSNSNSAVLTNTVGAQASSGGNTFTAGGDQNGGVVVTGNTASTVVVDNSANSNTVTGAFDLPAGPTDSIGLADGGSNAMVKFKVNDTFSDTGTNTLTNTNTIASNSTTGGNTFTAGGALNNMSLGTGTNDAAAGLTNTFNVNVKSITRTVRMP